MYHAIPAGSVEGWKGLMVEMSTSVRTALHTINSFGFSAKYSTFCAIQQLKVVYI